MNFLESAKISSVSCPFQNDSSSRQDLTTTFSDGNDEVRPLVEVRFILDARGQDVLRSNHSELTDIAKDYYCDILIDDSAVVISWKNTRRLPPKLLVKKVTEKVQTLIKKAEERVELLFPRFTATVVYPEIRDKRCQDLLVGCGNPRPMNYRNGWHSAEVCGTRTEVNEYVKCICAVVSQYTEEKLIVEEDQFKFLQVVEQCNRSFLTSVLADANTVNLQMEACRYICLNGRKDEVQIVTEHIVNVLSKMAKEELSRTAYVVNWVKEKPNLNYLQKLLIDQNIGAALEVKDGTLFAYGDSTSTAQAAAVILKKEVTRQPVAIKLDESRQLLTSPDHNAELTLILNNCAALFSEEQKWYLVGWSKDMSQITQNLGNFFNTYTLVTRKVHCSEAHIAYICTYCEADLKAIIAELTNHNILMKLKITEDPCGFSLEGSTDLVDCGKEKLQQLIGKVKTHLFPVYNVPNIKELLEDRISQIEKQSGTVIRLCDGDSLDSSTKYPSLSRHEPNASDVRCTELAGQMVDAKHAEDGLILPVQLELCDTQAEILVNSVHWSLNLERGAIAKSVLQRAGTPLQEELHRRYQKGLEFFQFATTNSYNIGCTAIIHVVCAPYCGKYTEDNLRSTFLACLKEAERKKAASIAFPAIGTGNLKYPPLTVFTLLSEAVAIFCKGRENSSLQKVYFSLTDPVHLEAFKEWRKKNLNRNIQPRNPSPAKAPDTSVLSIARDKSIVKVIESIPDRQWHVIIRFEGTKKSPCSDVSASRTKPGSIHIYKDVDSAKFTAALGAAIRRSESLNAKSLSIVANNNDKKTARCIAEAIRNYTDHAYGTITEISLIVAYDQRCYYCQSLLAKFYQPEYPIEKKGILDYVKVLWSPISYIMKRKDVVTSKTSESSDDPWEIAIYGTSSTQIQEAERCLVTLLSQECIFDDVNIDPEDFANLDDKQISSLVELGPKCDTRIIVLEEQRKVVISGISKEQIGRAREMVKDFLSAAKKEWYNSELKRHTLERAKSLMKSVQWQYQEDSGTWTNLDEIANMTVEDSSLQATAGYHNASTSIGKFYYDPCSTPNGILAGDGVGEKQYPFRRIDVTAWRDFPDTWVFCEDYLEYPVSKGTEEFDRVESEFLNDAGASANEVVKITRIQDPSSWKQFKIQEVKVRNSMMSGSEPCTRRLWHGASSETVSAIVKECFNRSYAKNDVLYGKGVYFARDASYAAQPQYAKPSGAMRTVILAEVITGSFTKGDPSMNVPPKRADSSGLLYNSTVDDERDPSIFVVYHDTQAYPLYVINFR